MDLDKLSLLGGAARYDVCASTSSGANKIKHPLLGSPPPRHLAFLYSGRALCFAPESADDQ